MNKIINALVFAVIASISLCLTAQEIYYTKTPTTQSMGQYRGRSYNKSYNNGRNRRFNANRRYQKTGVGGVYDPYWDDFDDNYMYPYNYLDEEDSFCSDCSR